MIPKYRNLTRLITTQIIYKMAKKEILLIKEILLKKEILLIKKISSYHTCGMSKCNCTFFFILDQVYKPKISRVQKD